MGNKPSHRIGYPELRDSIAGSLVGEQDLELFYSLCKVESVRTISNILHPSPSQLFLVVVSGEVSVQLTSLNLKHKPVTAVTYYPGETIHFFNSPILPASTNFEFNDSGECFRNGDIKLSLVFKSYPKSTARVIGMDRRAYDEMLLTAKTNLNSLTAFVGLNLSELAQKSAHLRAITPEQVAVFGPLVKLRLAHTGQIVPAYPQPYKPAQPGSKKIDRPLVTMPPVDCQQGCMSLVLSGCLLSVPHNTNMSALIAKVTGAEASFNTNKKGTPLANLKYRAPPTMPLSNKGTPDVFTIADIERSVPSAERDNSGRGRILLEMGAGAFTSMDDYLIRGSCPSLRQYVTTTPCVLGHISHAAMDALCEADPRFDRVLKRNFYMLALHWVKGVVPFLLDMDEWSLALLSCKIFMKGFETGAYIKRTGDPSEFAYIVLAGSCKEISISTPTPEMNVVEERLLRWGALFGETALTTNSPYFRTVVAAEPTTVLCLSKRVLDQIYHNNKAKLSEIRIRLMGTEVDLQHAIDHPRGSELFLAFLTTQRAAENLHFYKAVDKFDSMCRMVTRHYTQVMSMREKALGAGADSDALSRAAAEHAGDEDQAEYSARQTNPAGSVTTGTTAVTSAGAGAGSGAAGVVRSTAQDSHDVDRRSSNGGSSAHPSDIDISHVTGAGAHFNQDGDNTMPASNLSSDKTSVSSTRSNDSFSSFTHQAQQAQARTKTAFQKPHLEPIISMSNFAGLDMGDDDLLGDSRKTFSVKLKPRPAHLPYSHKALVSDGDYAEGDGFEDTSMRRREQEQELGISEMSLRRVVQSSAEFAPLVEATIMGLPGDPHEERDRQGKSNDHGDGSALSASREPKAHDGTDTAAVSRMPSADPEAAPTANNALTPQVPAEPSASTATSTLEAVADKAPNEQNKESKRRHHRSSFLKNKAEGRSAAYEAADQLRNRGSGDNEIPSDRVSEASHAGAHHPGSTHGGDSGEHNDHTPAPRLDHSQRSMKVSRQLHKIHKNIAELREVARNIICTFIYEGSPQQVNLPGMMRVRTERAFEDWSTCLLSASGKGGVIVSSKSRENSFEGVDQSGGLDETDTTPTPVPKLGQTAQHSSYGASFTESLKVVNSSLVPAPLLMGGSRAFSYRSAAMSSVESPYTIVGSTLSIFTDTQGIHLDRIDLSFVDLFKESKSEILKLLRDDKFPRWKATADFQAFIASVQPYDKDGRKAAVDNSGHVASERERSLCSNAPLPGDDYVI